MKKNTDTSTMRYYKGKIRDMEGQLSNALARIKKLENRIRKIPLSSTHTPTNMELFANDDINQMAEKGFGIGYSGGTYGVTKEMIANWIRNGDLPIPIHDHTNELKGGNAYANKGAALQ